MKVTCISNCHRSFAIIQDIVQFFKRSSESFRNARRKLHNILTGENIITEPPKGGSARQFGTIAFGAACVLYNWGNEINAYYKKSQMRRQRVRDWVSVEFICSTIDGLTLIAIVHLVPLNVFFVITTFFGKHVKKILLFMLDLQLHKTFLFTEYLVKTILCKYVNDIISDYLVCFIKNSFLV